jgi:response regulator of citrate/malate metabolism
MLPIIPAVMDNQFGNYLCQKIIEVADAETIDMVVNRILGNVVEISLNLHGTRAIQTLVDRLALRILDDQKNGIFNEGINHRTLSSIIQALN